jgi:hypothetical protein
MSSRSLAAARARRSGENAPPISGNRPGTSIHSHAAFAPQYTSNVKVARGQLQQPPSMQQQMQQQQMQQQPQQNPNGLPFSKLSVSDAIGLITLRLGRCEQWIIESEHENEDKNNSYDLPEGSQIIDSSIINNIISRLDTIEKKDFSNSNNNNPESNTELKENITQINEQLKKIIEEGSKHNLAIAKHTEQLFRFERELVETKDILKTFMLKYDMFAEETNNKLGDFEYAISDLEKNIIPENNDQENKDEENNDQENNDQENKDEDNGSETENNISYDSTADLKNIVKQQLANENL